MDMNNFLQSEATQFVGTAAANTIGLVIGTIHEDIKELLEIPDEYQAISIVSSRTGTVAQAIAIDDAVKAVNAKLLRFEMAIDAGKQCGQGCLFVLGAENISDARRLVEIALEQIDYWAACIYVNEVGHMESHVTPRAGEILHQIFGTPLGKAFGVIGAAPAGIGIVAVDQCMKAAPVDIVWYGSPSHNLTMMNEFSAGISGDVSAVQKALEAGKEVGCELLRVCGITPISITKVHEVCGTDYVKESYTPTSCLKPKEWLYRYATKFIERVGIIYESITFKWKSTSKWMYFPRTL